MLDVSAHREVLLDLAKKLKAPFFYYDLDALAKHAERLNRLPVKLFYALKANPLSSIIRTLHAEGFRFDVASIGELEQVLKQGVDPKDILHTGPCKSYEQLEYFLEKGVRIFVLESAQQLCDLKVLSNLKKLPVEALLRVQLIWDSDKENVLGGGGCQTPFGLLPNEWQEAKANGLFNDLSYLDIIGLHCFQWGNIVDINELKLIWSTITKKLIHLSVDLEINLKVIDLGGGLGVPYHNNANETLCLTEVDQALRELKATYLEGLDAEYWLELGRYAVGEYGGYVSRIVDKKTVNNKGLLITEGGAQHLLRPVLTQDPFPCQLLRDKLDTDVQTKAFHVHGPLCTSLDKMGGYLFPEDVSAGDYLLYDQVGAYGFSESMPFFLCHTLPAEVIFQDNKVHIVRAPVGAESWLK